MSNAIKAWAVDTAERAGVVAASSALGVIGGSAVGVLEVDWVAVLDVSSLAAVIAVLTSIAGSRIGVKSSASVNPDNLGAPVVDKNATAPLPPTA